MNKLDSDLVSNLLQANNHEITTDRSKADVIIYNTCSVRELAEQKVFSSLGKDAQRKEAIIRDSSPRKLIVGVMGCMAQRLGKKLKSQFSAVDFICAPGRLYELPDIIAQAAAGSTKPILLDPQRTQSSQPLANAQLELLDTTRTPSGSRHSFLRIMRGCNHFCNYCIVPFVRGPEVSRKPESIIEEAKKIIDAGTDYITLLGQTVNGYMFKDGSTTSFADLLALIADVPGLKRLDFVTSHPIGFNRDVLMAMRDLDPICPYIHCPPQSGSTAILKAMNRGYTREDYDLFVDTAREIVPDVVLAGDFIVGFPGETEADHEMSADLIRRSNFKNTFIFKYSPRPDTFAAKNLIDDIPDEVKKRRNNELLDVQREVGLICHRQNIGKRFEVFVEGPSTRHDKQEQPPTPDSTQMRGKTAGNYIVLFHAPENTIGTYVDVNITDAADLSLIGELA